MAEDINDAQVNKILDAIRDRLKPAEYYQQLIDLVEKMATINTQMTMGQEEIKNFIGEISSSIQNMINDNSQITDLIDLIREDISHIRSCDPCKYNLIHTDLDDLLTGDKHKFLDMVETIKREGLVEKVSGFVGFLKAVVLGATGIGLAGGMIAFFIWLAHKIGS